MNAAGGERACRLWSPLSASRLSWTNRSHPGVRGPQSSSPRRSNAGGQRDRRNDPRRTNRSSGMDFSACIRRLDCRKQRPPRLIAPPTDRDTVATPSPRAEVRGADVAAIVDAFVSIAIITAGKGGRVRRATDKRDAEHCKDCSQKNSTANHRCLSDILGRLPSFLMDCRRAPIVQLGLYHRG